MGFRRGSQTCRRQLRLARGDPRDRDDSSSLRTQRNANNTPYSVWWCPVVERWGVATTRVARTSGGGAGWGRGRTDMEAVPPHVAGRQRERVDSAGPPANACRREEGGYFASLSTGCLGRGFPTRGARTAEAGPPLPRRGRCAAWSGSRPAARCPDPRPVRQHPQRGHRRVPLHVAPPIPVSHRGCPSDHRPSSPLCPDRHRPPVDHAVPCPALNPATRSPSG